MSEWMLDFFDEDNPWKAQAIDRITRNSIDLISRNAKYILDPKVFGDCDYLYVGRDVCRPGLGHFPRFSWQAPAEGYFCIKFVFSLINESNINGARIKVFKENSFCLENRILYSELGDFSTCLKFEKGESIFIDIDFVTHLNFGDVLFYLNIDEGSSDLDSFINFESKIPNSWLKMSNNLGIANLNNGLDPLFINYLKLTSVNEAALNSTPNTALWDQVMKMFLERSSLGSSRLFNADKVNLK